MEQILVVIASAIGMILAYLASKFKPTVDPIVKPPGREADLLAYTQVGLQQRDRQLVIDFTGEIAKLIGSIDGLTRAHRAATEATEANTEALQAVIVEMKVQSRIGQTNLDRR